MANIILKDKNGTDITHMGIDYLCMRTLEGGLVRFNEGDIRVISVDELPSENIKEDAIYKVSATDEDGNAKVVFCTYVDGEWTEYKVGKDPVFENLEITENGTYTPAEGVDGWNEVTVNIESDPVLTELTVTENGVYDEPVIGGGEPEIAMGKTVTFKESYVIDESIMKISGRSLNAERVNIYPEVVSDSVFMITVGGSLVINGEQVEDAVAFYFNKAAVELEIPKDFGVFDEEEGWYYRASEGATPIKLDTPPSILLQTEMDVSLISYTSVLFAGSPTPADGWNKVTVNVPGDIIDVPELPTENIEEGKIYRVIEESEPILWYRSSGDSDIRSMPLTDYLVQSMGMSLTIHTHIVDVLPDSIEPMDMTTMTMHCYILNSTGVGYVSEDGTSESTVTIGEYLMNSADGGWIDSVNDIQATDKPTIYTLRGSSSTTYGIPNAHPVKRFVDGAWVELA